MKKINISSQLLVLFFIIVLVTSCAFSLIILTRIQLVAESEVYSRLSTYIHFIDKKEEEHFPDMNVGYYVINSENPSGYSSENLSTFVTTEELNKLIDEKLVTGILSNKAPNNHGFLLKNDKTKIYYVVSIKNTTNDYTIIFTDSVYTTKMVKNVAGQVILIFFLLIIVSIFFI